jgi:hypothetical protein
MNDNGNVNRRILASLKKPDPLQRLESAYRSVTTTFCSPDVKRLYLRFLRARPCGCTTSRFSRELNPHWGRGRRKCENHLAEQLQKLIENVDNAIEAGEALKQANGLTQQASFLPDGLVAEVRVTSPIMRRYLVLMEKTDQMIALLETLRIDGVVTTAACDTRRGQLKAQIKTFNGAARRLAMSLRARGEAAHKAADSAKQIQRKSRPGNDPASPATVPADGTNDNGAEHAAPPEIAAVPRRSRRQRNRGG